MKVSIDQAKVVCTNEFLRLLIKGDPFSMQEAFQPPGKPSESDHSVYVDIFRKKQWKQSVIDRVQKLGLLSVDPTKDRMYRGVLAEKVQELFADMLTDGDTSVAKWLLFPNDYDPPGELVELVPALQEAAPGTPVEDSVEAHATRAEQALHNSPLMGVVTKLMGAAKEGNEVEQLLTTRDGLKTMQSMLSALQHILETQKLIAASLKDIDTELSKKQAPSNERAMSTDSVTQVFRTIVDSAATALNKRLSDTEVRLIDKMQATYSQATLMIDKVARYTGVVDNYVKKTNIKAVLQQYLEAQRNEEWRTSRILKVIAEQSDKHSGEIRAALELMIEQHTIEEKDGEKNTG